MPTTSPSSHGIRPWHSEVVEYADYLIPRDIDDRKVEEIVRIPSRLGAHTMDYPAAPNAVWLTQDFVAAHIRALMAKVKSVDSLHATYGSQQFLDGEVSPHNYLHRLILHSAWRKDEPVQMGEVLACAHHIYQSTPIPQLAVSEVAYLLSRARAAFFESLHFGTTVTFGIAKKNSPTLTFGEGHWWNDVMSVRLEKPPLAFDFVLKDEPTASGRNVNWLIWLWLGSYLISDCVDSYEPQTRLPNGTPGMLWDDLVHQHVVQSDLHSRITRLSKHEYADVAPFLFAKVCDVQVIEDAIEQRVDVEFVASMLYDTSIDNDRRGAA